MPEYFMTVQVWYTRNLPEELREFIVRKHMGSDDMCPWSVCHVGGPDEDDGGYTEDNYGAEHIKNDAKVDAWLVEHGAEPGAKILWCRW